MTYCTRCGGEGKLYTSRYGGNDPDVWVTGECPVCEGTGSEPEGCADCGQTLPLLYPCFAQECRFNVDVSTVQVTERNDG